MPIARAIAGLSTPARIIAPRRVLSTSSHSASAATAAQTMSASRYFGKTRSPTRIGAAQPRPAPGSAARSPPQTHEA